MVELGGTNIPPEQGAPQRVDAMVKSVGLDRPGPLRRVLRGRQRRVESERSPRFANDELLACYKATPRPAGVVASGTVEILEAALPEFAELAEPVQDIDMRSEAP